MKIRESVVVVICLVALMNMKGEAKEVHVLNIPQTQASTEIQIETLKEYDNLEMLAKCVQAEAGNQGLLGKRLVVDVILNRVDSPQFPDTGEGVISQRGQFAVYPTALNNATPDEETLEAVRLEIRNRTDDRIIFFSAYKYLSCCTPAYQHGDHYFGY